MKNRDIMPMLQVISELGDLEITSIDAALAIVENYEVLNAAYKKNNDALNKVVKYSPEEIAFSEKITNEPDPEKSAGLEKENQVLADSIREKNEKKRKYEEELLEKPFNGRLKDIKQAQLQDKDGNLLKGIKLRHIAALKPILK